MKHRRSYISWNCVKDIRNSNKTTFACASKGLLHNEVFQLKQLLLCASVHEWVICTAAPLTLVTAARGHTPSVWRLLHVTRTSGNVPVLSPRCRSHMRKAILNLRSIYASEGICITVRASVSVIIFWQLGTKYSALTITPHRRSCKLSPDVIKPDVMQAMTETGLKDVMDK